LGPISIGPHTTSHVPTTSRCTQNSAGVHWIVCSWRDHRCLSGAHLLGNSTAHSVALALHPRRARNRGKERVAQGKPHGLGDRHRATEGKRSSRTATLNLVCRA